MRADSPDTIIEECEAEVETEVGPEVLDRAFELLARWALRHGARYLEGAQVYGHNRVTAGDVKAYGAHSGSN
jgi:hypothetical protein